MARKFTDKERYELAEKLYNLVPLDPADEDVLEEAIECISPEFVKAMDDLFDDIGEEAWKDIQNGEI